MVKKKNIITNGDLAGMISMGFQDMEVRLVSKDEFDNRINSIDNRINSIDNRINSIEKKIDKLDYQMDEVYDILKRFEENDILNLQKRVQILEKAVRALAVNQTSK